MTTMTKREKRNFIIFILVLTSLFFSLSILVWLRMKFEWEKKASIDKVVNSFDPITIIGSPRNIKQINFSSIEKLASQSLSDYIRNIFISKVVEGKGEILIHPFSYSINHPDWKKEFETFDKRELKSGEEILGYIYLDLDVRNILLIKYAILSLFILLIFTVGLVLIRIVTQEKVISKTTIELEEKKKEMIKLERLALAGQLTANIFHDIRKPVLNIKNELEYVKEKELTEEKSSVAKAFIENISKQISFFFSMLKDLNIEKFVSKTESGDEYIDINEIIKNSLNLVKYEQKDISVKLESDKGLPAILLNPTKLTQVFSNIILNAYQAMNGKGELIISTTKTDSIIKVRIKDDGPGLDQKSKEEIFTPFFTTKKDKEGTGLGLYISKTIINDINGKILVNSEKDKGCEFIIELPIN